MIGILRDIFDLAVKRLFVDEELVKKHALAAINRSHARMIDLWLDPEEDYDLYKIVKNGPDGRLMFESAARELGLNYHEAIELHYILKITGIPD
jgi:hypothetical protein